MSWDREETLHRGWVGTSWWVRFGELVGCYLVRRLVRGLVGPLRARPPTTKISLLNDTRQRTNRAWWAGGYRSVGADWQVSGLLGASVGA